MWAKVAVEMGVPWRAAEAMHWQLGEVYRAGVVPFSVSRVTMNSSSGHVRPTSHGSHAHSRSIISASRRGILTRIDPGKAMTKPPTTLPSVAEMIKGASPYPASLACNSGRELPYIKPRAIPASSPLFSTNS